MTRQTLLQHREENPTYWTLCVSRSQYSDDEIVSTLNEIICANSEWEKVQKTAYAMLENMGTLHGWDSENHKRLHMFIVEARGTLHPSMKQNNHRNCFPVATWKKDIKGLRQEIAKAKQLMEVIQ